MGSDRYVGGERCVAHLAVSCGKLLTVGDLRRAPARVPDEATVMDAGVEAPDGTTGRAVLREFSHAGPDSLGFGWLNVSADLQLDEVLPYEDIDGR
mgnify:CR=1 FL=1